MSLHCEGLDASSLLGFMATMGTFVLLDERARRLGLPLPRLAFDDRFRAVFFNLDVHESDFSTELLYQIQVSRRCFDDLKNSEGKDAVSPRDVGVVFQKAALDLKDANLLKWVAAMSCAVGDDVFENTLSAMNGSSAQNLIGSMRDVTRLVDASLLSKSIFGIWKTDFFVPKNVEWMNTRKATLRLDPSDDRPYALRLNKPDGKAGKAEYRSELGALALATFGYRAFPVVPLKSKQLTVASERLSGRTVAFDWALWREPTWLRCAQSFLFCGQTVTKARGAFAGFRCERLNIGKAYSFAPTKGLW